MTSEQERILFLESLVQQLLDKIAELEAELSRYRTPKNSSNSSIPPTQDPFRVKRTESLRSKSDKPAGGQPGHQASNLSFVPNPTEVRTHLPDNTCSACGNDLSEVSSEYAGKRQIIDLPPIAPTVTEHQIYRKKCCCGHFQHGHYPFARTAPVSYGEHLEAYTAYLHARQYISYERIQELFGETFGISISLGALVDMVERFAGKAQAVYQQIGRRISKSSSVGADETGVNINGKNHWAWVFQDESQTYISIDASRSKWAIDRIFAHGLPNCTLTHDCWKPYFKMDTASHQICTAHLLRELKYLDKIYPQTWSQDFTRLLLDAIDFKRGLRPSEYYFPMPQRDMFNDRLEALLNSQINPEHEKLVAFHKRITRYKDSLFRFLYRYNVSPDNNASERAVRTFKVKLKVSGLFRSTEGAQRFAIIRSVIDTTIKNSMKVFQALVLIAESG